MARKHQGMGESGKRPRKGGDEETGMRPPKGEGAGMRSHQGREGKPYQEGKRYQMDCRESGQGCSLTIAGSMEEVIMAGEMHARKSHGMRGSEEEVRRQLRGFVKEEERPVVGAGAGQRNEQREDMPPA